MSRIALALGVVAMTGAMVASHQDPQRPPVFRAGTDVSQVSVRVLNERDRTPVRDLTAADFTILINDVPQPIVAVVPEDVAGPIAPSAPWMRDVAPDIATNTLKNPRLIVIILDDALFGTMDPVHCPFNGLGGDPWSLKQTKAIATAIINQLGPSDLATVVFSADNRAPQDFTRDRTRLLAAVETFHATSIDCNLAKWYSAGTLKAARAFLSEVPERSSAIMWISPGLDNDPVWPKLIDRDSSMADQEHDTSLKGQLSQLIGQKLISSVPVYPISNVGLIAPVNVGPATPQERRSRAVQRSFAHSQAQTELANATGGRAIQDTNAPQNEVAAIFLENSLRYLVGYQLTNPAADGKYRRMKIQVNRKNVIVEPSDRLFLAPTAKAVASAALAPKPQATTSALAGIVPVADETLSLAVAPFASPAGASGKGRPMSVVAVLGLDLPVDATGRSVSDTVQVETRVFDGEGRVQIERHVETVRLGVTALRARGRYDLLSTLSLKPGRYNLRFSTSSAARQKTGAVYTDIVVPDFEKELVSVSGVVVSLAPGRVAMPVTEFRELLPIVPTTARSFVQGDRAAAFMRVYWGGEGPAAPVMMTATIVDARNVQVDERRDSLSPAPAGNVRAADYRVDLPLDRLSAGEYVLRLRIAPPNATAIQRDVRFVVR